MPATGFLRTAFDASLKKSERYNLHSIRTEPASGTQPITSGFSSAAVANSYSTTEHCRLSHRTPIATRVECCMIADDYKTLYRLNVSTVNHSENGEAKRSLTVAALYFSATRGQSEPRPLRE